MDKPRVKIERWALVPYKSYGDTRTMQLFGYAHDHPRLGSQQIYSSVVMTVNVAEGIVETLNTIYELI